MSGPDASWYDMPGSPAPGWLRREPDEPLLDMVVAGLPLPADAPQQMVALASGLADLAGPAGPGDLAGEADALAAYSAAVSPANVQVPGRSRVAAPAPAGRQARRGSRRPALRARLAVGITIAGIVASGTAAAYAGVLPAPVQNLAHTMIGAPTAHEHGHGDGGSHGGATAGRGRGRNGAESSSRGQGNHGTKAVRGQNANGKNAKGKKARGKAKAHPHPKHPAPSPTPSPSPKSHTKPPRHLHYVRG